MNIIETPIDGLFIVEPRVFEDPRGYFFESFSEKLFKEKSGVEVTFVQDNESLSSKGVLRGLHFQKEPYAQAKLVRVVRGAVQDVAVDLRAGSKTFGQYFSVVLSGENKRQFFIPEGFAHGFLTLEDNTVFQYKCSNYYQPSAEGSIIWNDSDIAVQWALSQQEYLLSQKDLKAPTFAQFLRERGEPFSR